MQSKYFLKVWANLLPRYNYDALSWHYDFTTMPISKRLEKRKIEKRQNFAFFFGRWYKFINFANT